jgi:hypothetical protein
MSMIVNQFSGGYGANQSVSPSSSSASVNIRPGALGCRFVNSGSNICYVRVGKGAQTASAADTPIRGDSEIILRIPSDADTVAFISASGTTLDIQPGEGGV